MNEAMESRRPFPSPPPAKSEARRVFSDTTSGNSGFHSTVTLTNSAPSRFDADRMEAALAMTQMSQGTDCKSTGQFTAIAESESDRQRNQHYLHRLDQNRGPMAAKQNTWPSKMIRQSPDISRGTEVDADGSPEVISHPHDHGAYRATPRDGRTVNEAELARMTKEVLERPHGISHASVGKFYRTCSQQHITTGSASTQAENRLHCEPSLASERLKVTEETADRRSSEENKQRLSRSSGMRRALSDEVDERRTSRSSLSQTLARQASDPSERRRSQLLRMRPVQSRDPVDGRLGVPEAPSSSVYLKHPERGSGLVSPVSAVGGGTPYWGIVALKLQGRYGPGILPYVPRVIALQEEEGITPESPTDRHIRQSFESDVFLASATIPLQAYKCSHNLIRDCSAVPTESAEKTPINDAQQYIVKALESVKVQDQLKTDLDMDAKPLDLTQSAPNLAASNAREHNLTTYSKYDQIATAQLGRSGSFGSLSALRAFYDDPSMTSWSKKIRSGSENSPLADTGAKDGVGTHSKICEGPSGDAAAGKVQDMDTNWNAEVEADAWRSEFRPRPYRTVCSYASSLARLSPTVTATPQSIAHTPSVADVDTSCNLENTTSGSSSPTDLQTVANDTSSAGSDVQISGSRPTGDAAAVDSGDETASSPAEMENCCNGRPLAAEECRNRVMDTLDLRESPPILKISVEERSLAVNGEEKNRSPAFDEEASDTRCAVNGRPMSNDHNHVSTPPPECGSSLPGSKDSLDLSWRLPLKKRRVLDQQVLPPAEQSDNRLPDSASVQDRVGFSVDEKPTAVCLKTQPAHQAECEYITLLLLTVVFMPPPTILCTEHHVFRSTVRPLSNVC